MDIKNKFGFRSILPEETQQAIDIELECFPPNEACSPKMMRDRINVAPDMFLVAVDKETGKIAGFLNGLATDETIFRDEFFIDANLHKPDGANVMLLGLDVLPAYRHQGLAREIMERYVQREQEKCRKLLILTCLESKVGMYEKMGYQNDGISQSTWGDEQWYVMSLDIQKKENER